MFQSMFRISKQSELPDAPHFPNLYTELWDGVKYLDRLRVVLLTQKEQDVGQELHHYQANGKELDHPLLRDLDFKVDENRFFYLSVDKPKCEWSYWTQLYAERLIGKLGFISGTFEDTGRYFESFTVEHPKKFPLQLPVDYLGIPLDYNAEQSPLITNILAVRMDSHIDLHVLNNYPHNRFGRPQTVNRDWGLNKPSWFMYDDLEYKMATASLWKVK